jgi:hypothetical protein
MAWAVFAIGRACGLQYKLRTYPTREAAESHLVLPKHWERSWVEEVPDKKTPNVMAPQPWSHQRVGSYDYILDANGKKVAALMGSYERREVIAAAICGARSVRKVFASAQR